MKTHLVAGAGKVPTERAKPTDFFQLTLDSLLAHVAILRANGTIIAVNAAWNSFATRNGLVESICGPGANYLEVCERASGPCSEEAHAVAHGIRAVSQGRVPDFQLEYPCHSTVEYRWFSVRVTRFVIDSEVHVVATHDNITEKKLTEIRLLEANRLLGAQAMTDGLTGVANRRHFDLTLAREWKRHSRSRSPLSLLLLDIDYFKRYNDSCGHLAGDDCLKEIARTIQSAAGRPGDLVARYGGEEFAVILAETDHAGSLAMANLVVEGLRLKRLPHPDSGAGPFVSMSIGCSTILPPQRGLVSEILVRADRALYQAKEEGRDRFNHFG
ncbi:diguanylate cyclase [Singulisphaera sp. Ch08]|uniref:diguanylate cyclase n=1 Tax=Singulisphaera sp. Ch08 TaxID=3120278 RepID=A0AAU7CMF0_9BACT